MSSSSSMDLLMCLLLLISPVVLAKSSSTVPAIFTFGDSIFDAGNNHYNKNCTAQADFPPYGSSFFHRPTGRFTNGRTVADFICNKLPPNSLTKTFLLLQGTLLLSLFSFLDAIIAAEFVGLPLQKPFLELQIQILNGTSNFSNGINFASAGSGLLLDTNKFMVNIYLDQIKCLFLVNHSLSTHIKCRAWHRSKPSYSNSRHL